MRPWLLSFNADTAVAAGKDARDLRDFRRGAPARLFPEFSGLQRGDAAAGPSLSARARSGVWSDLVRLGLRQDVHPVAGGAGFAGSEEAGLRVGRRGRRMADERRRLGAAAIEVPQRRPRYEGAGGQDPRARLSRPTLVGSAGRASRFQRGEGAPRGTAPERGRLQTEDLLLERLGLLSGLCSGRRAPSPVGDQDVPRLGLRRVETRRPAHERDAALL